MTDRQKLAEALALFLEHIDCDKSTIAMASMVRELEQYNYHHVMIAFDKCKTQYDKRISTKNIIDEIEALGGKKQSKPREPEPELPPLENDPGHHLHSEYMKYYSKYEGMTPKECIEQIKKICDKAEKNMFVNKKKRDWGL